MSKEDRNKIEFILECVRYDDEFGALDLSSVEPSWRTLACIAQQIYAEKEALHG